MAENTPVLPVVSSVRGAGTPYGQYTNAYEPQAAQVANYLANPQIVGMKPQPAQNVTQSWLQTLFDTSDKANTPLEWAWDGMLKGLNWTYDRMAQAETYAAAALPGGIQPLTWQQAGTISPGQALVGNVIYDWNALTGNQGQFNILNQRQREQMFTENTFGKIASGATDLGLSLVLDPFFVAGKFMKAGRLRYLDKAYATPQELDAAYSAATSDLLRVANGVSVREAHPVAQFATWATEKLPSGAPARSTQELMKHQVIRDATDQESIINLLQSADNPQEAIDGIFYMYGSDAARGRLTQQRNDLVGYIRDTQRKQLELRLQYRPKDREKLLNQYESTMNSAYDEMAAIEKTGDEAALKVAHDRFMSASDDYNAVYNMELPDPAVRRPWGSVKKTKQELDQIDAELNTMMQRDAFLQKAIRDEEGTINTLYGSLANQQRRFSSNTWLGRTVEASREARATAGYREAATKTALNPDGTKVRMWQRDVFGTSPTSRIINLWRWVGDEVPSGKWTLDGVGTQGTLREAAAMLNDSPIYSGAARTVEYKELVPKKVNGKTVKDAEGKVIKEEVTKTKEIGGVAAKEELLRWIVGTFNNEPMSGSYTRMQALENIEKRVLDDMADFYGLDKATMDIIRRRAQAERDSLVKQIREGRGFWVDEESKINKSPFLETHLANGTYMLNFRAIDKAIRRELNTGNVKRVTDTWDAAAGYAANVERTFQEVWRPAVLLRLGYTQRNVVEGLIRATAFAFTVDPKTSGQPVMDALKQTGLSMKNVVTPTLTERTVKKGVYDSKRFVKWRQAQANDFVNTEKAWVNQANTFRVSLDAAIAEGDELSAKVMRENLDYASSQIDNIRAQASLMDDDAVALQLFRDQGKSKSRLYSGTIDVGDPFIYRQAFNKNSPLAKVSLANLSGDQTRAMESAITSDGINRVLKNVLVQHHVEVSPDMGQAYFDGVSKVLRQFLNSDTGKLIIQGKNADEIAAWLVTDKKGMQWAEVLGMTHVAGEKAFKAENFDNALEYASEMIFRYNSIAATPELRTYLKGVTDIEGATVANFLKDATGLKPVIGDYSVTLGTNKFMDSYRAVTKALFHALGTVPEDTLVRAPFYGRRYEQVFTDSYRKYMATTPEKYVSMRDIQQLQFNAHQRALKDTKATLYTIERRTNLGNIGEHLFPFISATQNSTTVMGRLIWNDPRIAVAMGKLWQAPDKMGVEDEQGNIRIPIPHNLIPDAVEKAIGIDNMMNVKINKNGLNVVFPQAGMSNIPIPQAGPLVTVPASEMMKHGWFGQSIDAPAVLKAALGDDAANSMWNGWKDYLYGQGQGVSEKTLSYDFMLPPWMQKAIQMKDGELNSTQYGYQYALQYRTELAKYMAGYRDSVPSADEIKTRTNNLYMLRILGNLTAFTPPQYESKLQPLIDAIRLNNQAYGLDGARMNSELFGDYLLMLGDLTTTKNVAGAMANVTAYDNARRYEGLLQKVAPEVQSNLSVLGILLNNDNRNAEYDPSVLTWQNVSNIPGLSEHFREMQTPQESMIEAQKNAGWIAYIKMSDKIDAIRIERGLSSLRPARAADLRAAKKQFIDKMANDPNYSGWYADYLDIGSTKTVSAVRVLEAALADKDFVKANAGKAVWQVARLYLTARSQVLAGTMSEDEWADYRGSLIARNHDWAAIANRYLTNDDQPKPVGVSYATMGG